MKVNWKSGSIRLKTEDSIVLKLMRSATATGPASNSPKGHKGSKMKKYNIEPITAKWTFPVLLIEQVHLFIIFMRRRIQGFRCE